MNDAVTATLPTNLAPVTPTQETPATRGRVASPRTVAIRAMLTETNGELTYSAAVPLLKQQGHEVDQNSFNVIKSSWKKNQKPSDAPKTKTPNKVDKKATPVSPSLPEVTTTEAIDYVSEVGGLAKAEADVRRRVALVKAFRKLLKQAQKLAA